MNHKSDHDSDSERTNTHLLLSRGTMVQHYRIVEKIGAGGMGEVYLAEDTKLDRQVALKFLPAHLVTNPDTRTRFVREAQTLAKLSHPNVITVFDVNEHDGRPFYAMELVRGESLHHYAHDEPLPVDMIVEYAIQICQGLAEAHRAGIVHRDVKAANIAVDKKGRVRLLDFGLAAREGDDKITKTGSTLGTVSYMSPEQVSGRDLDHRSDLFSLGTVLYELIAGRTPFKRDNEGATLKAIMQDTPEPLTRYKSDVPEKLRDVVIKLLEKDKELRYQSAEGVIADLKRLVYDSQQTASSRPAGGLPSRKTKLWVGLGAAAIVIMALLGGYLFTRSESPQSVAQQREEPKIAVLPFENLGSAEDEYFADGMTAEINARLLGIEGLGVISNASAMKFKGSNKTVTEIGAELDVDYILDGTIRWSKIAGDVEVRITPQLIRVADDRPLWADNFQRKLLEVFAVQAEIAEQIVAQLDVNLTTSERNSLSVRPTENARAYEFYLQGLAGLKGMDRLLEAVPPSAAFDSAVALDPNFALAHAMRSQAYSIRAFIPFIREGGEQALASAQRALELDPKLPQARVALGTYYNLVLNDYDKALEQFRLARSELHSDPNVLSGIAVVHLRQGRFQEAQHQLARVVELDPLSAQNYWLLAHAHWAEAELAEAEEYMNRAIALSPDNAGYYWAKGAVLASRYGEVAPIEEVIKDAFANCDTVDLLMEWRFWYELDLVSGYDIAALIEKLQHERNHLSRRVLVERAYRSLAHGYRIIGNTATSQVYFDSTRMMLEEKLAESPDDPHHSTNLGQVHAYLGNCEEAIEYGVRGKELLSVNECHW